MRRIGLAVVLALGIALAPVAAKGQATGQVSAGSEFSMRLRQGANPSRLSAKPCVPLATWRVATSSSNRGPPTAA
jgi:hypothetical protein